jgi:hypothetical protein
MAWLKDPSVEVEEVGVVVVYVPVLKYTASVAY